MTEETIICGDLPPDFEIVKTGLETSEDPAYYDPAGFFTTISPIYAYAIDTVRSRANGHYYFATQHILYEPRFGSRQITEHSLKLVNLSYAMTLESMRAEKFRPTTTDRHDVPVDNVKAMLGSRMIDEWLKKMLIQDLKELKDTMSIGAFRSAIGCCGRCLEGVIKTIFKINNSKFDDNWCVGKLLTELATHGFDLDSSSKNIANIINSYRKFSVHCKTESKLPIPSEYDAAGVMFLTLGLIERCILDKLPSK